MTIRTALLSLILFSAVATSPVVAETVFWDGGAGTSSWSNPLNWSTDAVPGPNDDVIIDTPEPTTVDICCGSGTISVRSIECYETLFVRTGTLSIANQSTILGQLVIGQVSTTVQLTGTGDLVIVGSLIWTRGTISGGGQVVVRLGANAHVETSLGGTLTRALLNSGELVFQNAIVSLSSASGGIPNIRNTAEGTMTLVSNVVGASIHQPGSGPVKSLLVNEGVIHVQGGIQSRITGNLHFENSGSVILESGGLTLGSGFGSGTNEGTIEVTAGTLLELADDFVHTPRSHILGGGQVTFKDGTSEFPPGTFGATGPLVFQVGHATFDGTISPSSVLVATDGVVGGETGTAVFNGPIVPPIAIVNHGSLVFNCDQTLLQLTMSSVAASDPQLDGTGVVTITESLIWSFGRMIGLGRTIVAAGASGTFDDASLSRIMDIEGTASGALEFDHGTLNILPGGVFNDLVASTVSSPSGPSQVNNAGLIHCSGGLLRVPLFNTGKVLVEQGTVEFQGGGVNSGVIEVLEGGLCSFESSMTHLDGSQTGGPGQFAFAFGENDFPAGTFLPTGSLTVLGRGTLAINNSCNLTGPVTLAGRLAVNADQSWPTLIIRLVSSVGLSTLTLEGSADLTITERLRWERGFMAGTGRTIVAEGATFEMNSTGERLLARIFLLAGEHTVFGPFGPSGSFGSSINFHNGTLNILPTGKFVALSEDGFDTSLGGVNQVNCAGGVLEKRRGASVDIFVFNVPFYNAGTVDVFDGLLELHSVGNYDPGTRTLAGGTWIVRHGANLQMPAAVQPLRLGASVTLLGPTSSFSAITFIDTILASGALTLRDSRQFAGLPLASGIFLNHGLISVETNSQFTSAMGFSQSSTGQLSTSLNESSPVPFSVTGAATVSGALQVDFEPGFLPDLGQTISVLTAAGGASGTFDVVELPGTPPLPCGLATEVLYESAGVSLTVEGSTSPDLDCNGTVDSLDLGVLLSSWSIPATAPGCGGALPCPADLNDDGFVNSLDLGMLLASWTL